MNLRSFLNLCDDWNGLVVNVTDSQGLVVKGRPEVVLSYQGTYLRTVVGFTICDNELFVRVENY